MAENLVDPILAWELVPWQFEPIDLGPSLFWYWALGLLDSDMESNGACPVGTQCTSEEKVDERSTTPR